jgi:hypothetical protein
VLEFRNRSQKFVNDCVASIGLLVLSDAVRMASQEHNFVVVVLPQSDPEAKFFDQAAVSQLPDNPQHRLFVQAPFSLGLKFIAYHLFDVVDRDHF